jgi:cell fate regulator YaaT (PSP1 superfamily)
MPIVVGISLRQGGRLYQYDPGEQRFYRGEKVVVETQRGLEIGVVREPPRDAPDDDANAPIRPVLRRATASDTAREADNREREFLVIQTCRRHVERLGLPMRLISAHYSLDGGHVLVFFLAEHRVDFRELVRDAARELHVRIELRQVGVRDEAKIIGGHGVCGRPLCCSTFLAGFAPVAISMAKAQGLALNPQKISGQCGRLMCCLAFEYEHYHGIRVTLPKLNAQVETPGGMGKVTKLNVLARQIEVTIPDQPAPLWFTVEEGGGMAPVLDAPTPARRLERPRDVGSLAALRTDAARKAGPQVAEMVAEPAADGDVKSKRRRKRKKPGTAGSAPEGQVSRPPRPKPAQPAAPAAAPTGEGDAAAKAKRRRRRQKPRPDGAPSGDMPPGRYRPQRGPGDGGSPAPQGGE